MTRHGNADGSRPAKASRRAKHQSHADRLVEIIDYLTAAKQTADDSGERFLSYLVSMAIQESRQAIRTSQSAGPH